MFGSVFLIAHCRFCIYSEVKFGIKNWQSIVLQFSTTEDGEIYQINATLGNIAGNSALIMAALCNRTGHYIFAQLFLLLSFFFLFSSPNLSGRRVDVYHTSTHGVALVRI